MKKKLLYLLLGLINVFYVFPQKIEIFDKKFEDNGVCMKSCRVRVINNNPSRSVNRLGLVVYPEGQESIHGPVRPFYSRAITRPVRILPNGSEVFESGVIEIGGHDANLVIRATARYRRGVRNILRWRKKTKRDRCDLSTFKRYVVMSRGETLDRARYLNCVDAQGVTQDVNLELPIDLKKGGIYLLKMSWAERFYEVINVFPASSFAELTYANEPVSGPFSKDCTGVFDGDADEDDNMDTSNYDLELKESDVFVYSACGSCVSQLSSLNPGFLGGTFPVRKHLMTTEGNAVQTQFLIKNNGLTYSKSTKVRFYLSKEYNSIFGVEANDKFLDIGSLPPGGEFLANPTFNFSDFKVVPGIYYFVIDIENGEGESKDENNFISIPIEIKSISGKRTIQVRGDEKRGMIEIYNFNGTKHSEHVIETKQKEKSIINGLGKGLYIIKKDQEFYKVSK